MPSAVDWTLPYTICPLTGEIFNVPGGTDLVVRDSDWVCPQQCCLSKPPTTQEPPKATHSLDSSRNRQAYYADLRNFAYAIRWDHTDLPDFITEVGAKALTMLGLVGWDLDVPFTREHLDRVVKAVDDAKDCCIWVWEHFNAVPQHHKDRPGAVAFLNAGGQLKPAWFNPDESPTKQATGD